jgi:rhodanese-related sulfurtransferase
MVIRVKYMLGVLSAVLLLALPGCNWFKREGKEHGSSCAHRHCGTKSSSVAEAKKFLVINVLDKELYDDARIPGSISIPYEHFEQVIAQMLQKNEIDTKTQMVTYCTNYACTGSGEAARMLKKLGFTSVQAYEAGMAEWYALSQKNPLYVVEGSATQPYLKKVVQKPAEKLYTDIDEIDAEGLRALLCSVQ